MSTLDDRLLKSVFKNGTAYVSAEVIDCENPNVIKYRDDGIWFIELVGIDSRRHDEFVNVYAYEELLTKISGQNVGSVPSPIRTRAVDAGLVKQMKSDWNTLVARISIDAGRHGNVPSYWINNISKVRSALAYIKLMDDGNVFNASQSGNSNIALAWAVADRLSNGTKQVLNKGMFLSTSDWKRFQEIEEDVVIFNNEALRPLEEFFIRLGDAVVATFDPSLSDPDDVSFVNSELQRVQSLISTDSCDEQVLRKACMFASQFPRLVRNMEGVVFDWCGFRLKLTGSFARVNRLLGLFKYKSG